MTGKFGRGAFYALLTAAAIAGCSNNKSGTTVVGGSPGDLNNPDNVQGASTIAQNNLADDTGAFSNNGQNITNFKVIFNSTGTISSSVQSAADGSAIVAFTTDDAAGNNGRLYLSHCENGSFTPPVEVSGEERDELKQSNDIDVQSIIAMPLNTSGYKDSTGQSSSGIADHKGNWVILWTATTRFTDPKMFTSTGVGSVADNGVESSGVSGSTSALAGPRRTIYYTLFLHSLRSSSLATSDLRGKASSATGAGPNLDTYGYGFMLRAEDLVKHHNSLFVGGDAPLTKAGIRNLHRPAEDVLNFGVSSDALVGTARFSVSTNGLNPTDPITAGPGGLALADLNNAAVLKKIGTSSGGQVRPGKADYQVGDAMTYLRLYFVQLTSSRSGASDTYTQPQLNAATDIHGGARLRMFTADYNLDTMEFVDAVEVAPTAKRQDPALNTAHNLHTQPSPLQLGAYNGHFFWQYLDASQASDNATVANSAGMGFGLDVDQTLGAGIGVPSMRSITKVQAISTIQAVNSAGSGIGTSTAPKTTDLTIAGTTTAGIAAHVTGNTTGTVCPDGPTPNPTTAAPFNAIGPVDESTAVGVGNQGDVVFGADHGLVDTSVYFLAQCNTVVLSGTTPTANKTEEIQLCCAVIDPLTGLLVGQKIISQHTAVTAVGSAGVSATQNSDGRVSAIVQAKMDSVVDFACAESRTGSYILTVFRQMSGDTLDCNLVLNYTAQQCYTDASITPVPGLDVRFATAPKQLNTVVQHTRSGELNAGISSALVTNSTWVGGTTRGGFNPARGFLAGERKLLNIGANPGTLDDALAPLVPGTISGDTVDTFAGFTNLQGLHGIPVTAFKMQQDLGFACGIQSDLSKMNVAWTIGDGTEDQLFMEQLTVTVSATSTPTPTLAATLTEHEILGPASVNGPGLFTSFDQSGIASAGIFTGGVKDSFKFLPHSIDLTQDVAVTDLGKDAQQTAVGGGCIVWFWRIDDATVKGDGDFFNTAIYATSFDGTALGTPTPVGRTVKEDNNNNALLAVAGTGIVLQQDFSKTAVRDFVNAARGAFVQNKLGTVITLPRSSTGASDGTNEGDFQVLVFRATSGDSGTSTAAIYARQFDETVRRSQQQTPVTFDKQFNPNSGTDATRLSRLETSGQCNVDDTFHDGKHLAVVFRQDRHEWVSQTDDGIKWSQDSNGKPLPPLLDNNTTADVQFYVQGHKPTSSCDDLRGSIMGFVKQDISNTGTGGDQRLFIRTWN